MLPRFGTHTCLTYVKSIRCAGSALANASALWSFTAIAISLLLKRTYPGGIPLRKYQDEQESKRLSKGASAAVHPVNDDGERADGLDKPI